MLSRLQWRENIPLALPVVFGQIGHIAASVADSIMVGRLGVIPLAAVSYGASIASVPFVFGIGLAYGLTPFVANAVGQKRHGKGIRLLKHSVIVNLVTAMVMMLAVWLIHMVASQTGQDAKMLVVAEDYLYIYMLSFVPFMAFLAAKQYIEGLGDTKTPMRISLWGNTLNITLNALLIFGLFGFPAMGITGAAVATVIARMVMAVWIWRHLFVSGKVTVPEWAAAVYQRHLVGGLLKVGIPSGLQYIFEVSAFSISAIIIGTYGAMPLAAHQVAISLASISYMAATGLGASATIRVAQFIGQRKPAKAREAGTSLFLLTSLFMVFTGLFFFFGRHIMPYAYTDVVLVAQSAAALLVVATIFQLSDGLQAAALGALRGAKDVRVPTLISFLSYYVVALPLEWYLGTVLGYGAVGVWAALAVGLTLSAVLLTQRFYKVVS
ncbi:MAG: MATE family efflux transporter [Proteobacteria bacterium]|nr:MATE family efflux transporter [Pseudomonadota bacterium]